MAAKLRPYPKYKESGIEWLKEVPKHWSIVQIKYISSINPKKSEVSHLKDLDCTFLPMEKIKTGSIQTDLDKQIKDVFEGYNYFKENDILMAKVTPCFENKNIAIASNLKNKIGFGSTEIYVFRCSSAASNQFLYYRLQENQFMSIATAQMTGAGGLKRVPQDFVSSFIIAIPSHKEQITIANYLDQQTTKIDQLIKNYQKLMTLLKEKRTALITHCVTKGLDPKVKMKNSGVEWLGEVPDYWKVCCLKRNLRLKTQKSVFTKDEHLVALENIEGFTGKYIKTDADYSGEAVSFNPKDILFGKLRPYLAKVFHCYQHGFAFGDLLVYESKSDSKFAFYQMLSDWFIRVIDSSTYGAKMPRASSEFIGEMDITLPPLQEQTTIANHLDQQTAKIDQTLSKAEKAIELLKEKRTALITAAVTGKIDLRETVS